MCVFEHFYGERARTLYPILRGAYDPKIPRSFILRAFSGFIVKIDCHQILTLGRLQTLWDIVSSSVKWDRPVRIGILNLKIKVNNSKYLLSTYSFFFLFYGYHAVHGTGSVCPRPISPHFPYSKPLFYSVSMNLAFLDSTHKWYPIVFVFFFVWHTWLSIMFTRLIHVLQMPGFPSFS